MKRAVLLAAGAVLTVSLAGAALADLPVVEDSDPFALELLAAASHAGRQSNYEGTQLVLLWLGEKQLSASVQISHRAGSGSMIRVEGTTSTAERTVFEPDGQGSAGMAGPSAEALALVRRNFVVSLEGSDDVLGRPVHIVLVRTRAGQPVQRLWIDRSSGLPLRRKFYHENGQLVRQTAFVSLTERTPSFATVPVATVPVRRSTGTVDVAALRAQGWSVPAAPDGMVAYDAVVSGTGAAAVLHLAFTDGIQSMSLFEQRGRLEDSGAALRGWRRTRIDGTRVWISGGYPHRAVWASGEHVYTVVTECPEQSVEQMVRSLPRGGAPDGLAPRVRRGALRVASWVNPAG